MTTALGRKNRGTCDGVHAGDVVAEARDSNVIVKLKDNVDVPYVDDVLPHLIERDLLEDDDRRSWSRVFREHPGIAIGRLFTTCEPDEIRCMVRAATRRHPDYEPPNFLTYFAVHCPAVLDADSLADTLSSRPDVEVAYVEPPASEPSVDPGNNPRFASQAYLKQAPGGIGASSVWPRVDPNTGKGVGYDGADGEGVQFIDLERGWMLDHEDLQDHGAKVISGQSAKMSSGFVTVNHGTKTLGVACAVDNDIGCVGIAPNVDRVSVVAHDGKNVANAICAAAKNLSDGDVLLLEVQQPMKPRPDADQPVWLPIEAGGEKWANYEQILLASKNGITVVEPAGNGNFDLDEFVASDGTKHFTDPDRDSGAIIVGASTSDVPHEKIAPGTNKWDWGSNYGSRVHCYAWGEKVHTCKAYYKTSPKKYTGINKSPDDAAYHGTSAAGAIIAGVALAVQGMAKARVLGGGPLDPAKLRAILGDPLFGTESKNGKVTDKIGVMPDLEKVADEVARPALVSLQWYRPRAYKPVVVIDFDPGPLDRGFVPPFEVIADLPAGARAWVSVPIRQPHETDSATDTSEPSRADRPVRVTRVEVEPAGSTVVEGLPGLSDTPMQCRLVVRLPENGEARDRCQEVLVRRLTDGRDLASLTLNRSAT